LLSPSLSNAFSCSSTDNMVLNRSLCFYLFPFCQQGACLQGIKAIQN
jgi:hypothetical protein